MQQQYYIVVPWNGNLRNCSFDDQELVTLCELLPGSSLPTDTNRYQSNCILNFLGTGLYQNVGTVVSPVFEPMSIDSPVNGVVFNFPVFTGGPTDLNDLRIGSAFTGAVGTTYTITIDSTGITDTFSWVCSTGGGATMVPMTSSIQILNNGVAINFNAQTGHTLNDSWIYTAIPVQMSFIIGNEGNNTLIGFEYADSTNNMIGVNAFGNFNGDPIGGIWGLVRQGGGQNNANVSARYDGTVLEIGMEAQNTNSIIDMNWILTTDRGGTISTNGIQEFATNAAAILGGLQTGDLYYTNSVGDGILKIVI